MSAPPSDQRLAEIEAHAPNCRYGCIACEAAPDLVAEIRRLREAHASLAAAFDGVCGERDQARRDQEETAERLTAEADRRLRDWEQLWAERNQLRDRIASARAEIARQEMDGDGELSFSAFTAVEAHLVDPEHRAATNTPGGTRRITDAATRFRAERDRLHDVLGEVLAEPWDPDDPVLAERLERWRDVLAATERSEHDGGASGR